MEVQEGQLMPPSRLELGSMLAVVQKMDVSSSGGL